MNRRAIILLMAVLAISFLFAGCEWFTMDKAEFSSALLKGVMDNGKGHIEESAKAPLYNTFYDQDGLTLGLEDSTAASLRADFNSYEVYGSTVTGAVIASIDLELDGSLNLISITLIFYNPSGPLTVDGKHEGLYEFNDATITYDMATGEYSFGGSVTIDGVIHYL
jgi:hypothetical protein